MPHPLRKTFRRLTVGLTSAALVASSFGVAAVGTAPAASAQALRAGAASMNIPAAAPENVQARPGGPNRGPGVNRPGRGPGPGYGRPGRPGPGYVARPGRGPGWHGPRPGYHPRWGRPYWRNNGWYYRNNNGAWVAAGIAGLAIGAAAGAAAANANRSDAIAYCSQRFRSYNPRTGTYTGYDGRQHPCP